MRINYLTKTKGTAIFMALMIVALATTLSVIWYRQSGISVKRTNQLLIADQAYLFSDSVLDWAIGALQTDDKMPKVLMRIATPNYPGFIAGRLDDYSLYVKNATTGTAAKAAMAAVSPQYFLLRAEVKLADQYLILYSLLQRKMIDGKIQVGIVWQSHGLN